jgi:hypothetical protein
LVPSVNKAGLRIWLDQQVFLSVSDSDRQARLGPPYDKSNDPNESARIKLILLPASLSPDTARP